ncbi:hypothetical protein [Paraburkholderia caribensis]|uniref:hypothetical protein n=1 Tax=Paraburkholderia caribensis TaxID=75105 RepID=UPI002856AA38|nr:hypothetical protein [Paraburkholderia caribensis]MDR6384016.1 hypothetical protein [Paraburkholderia caribensis]
MTRTSTDVFRVLAAFPRVLRRRRARGGLTHEQFKDACVIVQMGALLHCFVPASLWWARNHDGDAGSWTNWLGVAMAVALVVSFWWFLLKQAYIALESATALEIRR